MSGDTGQHHLVTPTVKSPPISVAAGFSVYLKLENLQIPGSFKIRGVGNLVRKVHITQGVNFLTPFYRVSSG